eukprot:scaffold1715_cov176-Alexandrium_tamarense.AAC.3
MIWRDHISSSSSVCCIERTLGSGIDATSHILGLTLLVFVNFTHFKANFTKRSVFVVRVYQTQRNKSERPLSGIDQGESTQGAQIRASGIV